MYACHYNTPQKSHTLTFFGNGEFWVLPVKKGVFQPASPPADL